MTLSVSVSSPNEMIASLPNSTLPKITLEPHYESLVKLRDALKKNNPSIPSRRGGETYGYIGGLQYNAVYAIIIPGTAFIIPPNPGPLVIPSGNNSFNSGNLNRDHSEAVRGSRSGSIWSAQAKKSRKQRAKLFFPEFFTAIEDLHISV